MPIAVESYITWSGAVRINICHAPQGCKPHAGAPGVRTTMLDEADARELLAQLSRALAPRDPVEIQVEELFEGPDAD